VADEAARIAEKLPYRLLAKILRPEQPRRPACEATATLPKASREPARLRVCLRFFEAKSCDQIESFDSI